MSDRCPSCGKPYLTSSYVCDCSVERFAYPPTPLPDNHTAICPTCGHPREVFTSDEGSSGFVPPTPHHDEVDAGEDEENQLYSPMYRIVEAWAENDPEKFRVNCNLLRSALTAERERAEVAEATLRVEVAQMEAEKALAYAGGAEAGRAWASEQINNAPDPTAVLALWEAAEMADDALARFLKAHRSSCLWDFTRDSGCGDCEWDYICDAYRTIREREALRPWGEAQRSALDTRTPVR